MVCKSHLSIRSARTRWPVPSSKSTLSGSTTAARPPAFSPAVDVLQEHQLLVAGRVNDVVARGAAAALLSAEGRIREDHVGFRQASASGTEGVAELDVALHAVQHQVHEREAVHVGHQLHAVERLLALEGLHARGQLEQVVRLGPDVAVGVDKEAAGAGGGILNQLFGLGLHQRDHALDERARREVLAGAALHLLGVLLEQAFVEIAETLFFGAIPVQIVDGFDDGVEVPRVPGHEADRSIGYHGPGPRWSRKRAERSTRGLWCGWATKCAAGTRRGTGRRPVDLG